MIIIIRTAATIPAINSEFVEGSVVANVVDGLTVYTAV